MNLITNSFVVLAALPFVPFVAVLFLASYLTGDKKKSFKLAMDVTTLFLIAVVAGLYNVILNSSIGLYGIMLIMLLAAGLLGGAMQRKYGKVNTVKLFRSIWRISFFILSVLYTVLLVIGLILYTAKL